MSDDKPVARKLHTIRWEIICRPKFRGGLGVKVLAWKNTALLAKWWWKSRVDRSKLWHRVLTCKYGGKFLSNPMRGSKNVSPMIKQIASIKNHSQLNLFEDHDVSWRLGQGNKIKFWTECWTHQCILAEKFQRLFELIEHKEEKVSIMINQWDRISKGLSNHWRRDLRGWEIDDLETLDSWIHNTTTTNKVDRLTWNANNEEYSSIQGYRLLQNQEGFDIEWKVLWKI